MNEGALAEFVSIQQNINQLLKERGDDTAETIRGMIKALDQSVETMTHLRDACQVLGERVAVLEAELNRRMAEEDDRNGIS